MKTRMLILDVEEIQMFATEDGLVGNLEYELEELFEEIPEENFEIRIVKMDYLKDFAPDEIIGYFRSMFVGGLYEEYEFNSLWTFSNEAIKEEI